MSIFGIWINKLKVGPACSVNYLVYAKYITQVHFCRGFSENIYQIVYSGFTWNEFIFFVLRLFVFIFKNEGLHF